MLRAAGTFPTVKSYLISQSPEHLFQDKISPRNRAAIGNNLRKRTVLDCFREGKVSARAQQGRLGSAREETLAGRLQKTWI
jgi:hypothetical protein